MVHLKPRSELFKKFAGLVYDECQYGEQSFMAGVAS